MPKFRTTNREMMNESLCYAVGYGDLQHLFHYKNAVAYTAGIYGWNSDIYVLGDTNTYISTGYRPCGYRLKDSWIYHAIDFRAKKIIESSLSYEEKKQKLDELIRTLYEILSEDWRISAKSRIWTTEEKAEAKARYDRLAESVKISDEN